MEVRRGLAEAVVKSDGLIVDRRRQEPAVMNSSTTMTEGEELEHDSSRGGQQGDRDLDWWRAV